MEFLLQPVFFILTFKYLKIGNNPQGRLLCPGFDAEHRGIKPILSRLPKGT
jgi:hypothetical protein